MTSVGRGRGWGSNQDKGIPLRRPGELAVSTDMEMDSIVAAVQGISLQDPNESMATLRGVEELLKNRCQTEENLKLVVQRLHDRSLEDRQFGMKAAAACGSVSSLEVGALKLRNVLLLTVQRDFQDRAHLQTSCNLKFLNAISLLGEIFHRVRLPDGSPITILASAVLQYQDMLLGGEEHEMELFTTQLAVNGRKLYDCKASDLEELMQRVRTTLMSRNLSGQCRCWLLLALDLAANRYAPLSGQLQAFYQVHLGANAIIQLQRLQLGLQVDTNNGRTETTNHVLATNVAEKKSGDGEGILVKYDQLDQKSIVENGGITMPFRPSGKSAKTSSQEAVKKTHKSPGEEHGTKSGGERGKKFNVSGGEEQTRRKSWGHKKQDGDQNEDVWGTARGDRGETWGHDDRFVKDVDFYGKQTQRGEGAVRPRNRDGNWRDRKGSDGKEQKNKTVSSNKSEAEPVAPPPPLPEEESWD